MAKVDDIREMIAPTVEALGFELWGLEYLSQGRHTLLRIYIESAAGVSVDDCASVSHHVSGVLDVEDPIAGEYTLEVSSPGMDRMLFALGQYPQYAGEWIAIRLRIPFDGRRNFKGVLTGVEGDDVIVRVDDHEYLLPFNLIDKAKIVPTFEDKE